MAVAEHFRKHALVHLGWIVAILVSTNIGLASLKLGPNDNVKDILNFAVSLASLVLALVAIGQALFSGGALSEAVVTVRTALNEVRAPAEELANTARVLTAYSEKIDVSTNELSLRISSMMAQKTMIGPVEIQVADRPTLDDKILEDMFVNAKVALYLAVMSFKTKKPFIGVKLSSQPATFHAYGFISALVNLRIIRIDKEYTVLDLGALKWLESRLDDLRTSKTKGGGEYLQKQLPLADAFFEGTNPSLE